MGTTRLNEGLQTWKATLYLHEHAGTAPATVARVCSQHINGIVDAFASDRSAIESPSPERVGGALNLGYYAACTKFPSNITPPNDYFGAKS